MALASEVAGEEYYRIAIGQGMYTSELPSNIPDGYSAICYNLVASGDSLENRIGIRRSSVNWQVLEISPNSSASDSDDYNYFVQIDPWGKDASLPAFMWGSRGRTVPGAVVNSNAINAVRAAGTGGTGTDGFMSVGVPNPVTGIAQYNGTIYFILNTVGVQKISAMNFTADTITYAQVASSAGATMKGLFTFKDRLWAFNKNLLYFTNIPTVGGLPETWTFASNVFRFVGPTGAGNIKKVIPLGNRLAVFTSNGLFTLLVEGEPASWILRILDSKSISTTSQCAFESKGIIYYINTQGVWATNTLAVTKLSAVIEDQFFLAKGSRIHAICSYEDGMLISIAKQLVSNENYFDKDSCKVLYSKLDPVGWTEWNINSYDLGTQPERMVMMWSMTDKIPTYLNKEPTVYCMSFVTDSVEATGQYSVAQFLVMDGGSDQYVDRTNTLRAAPVGLFLKTKHFDGGNQYNIKRAKRCMLELFTSDEQHSFTTSWDIDTTIDSATEVQEVSMNDYTVGVGSNLLKIPNQFYYRRAAFNLRVQLQSDNSQIKIKDIAIAQDTGRSEYEFIR